ncbi:GlsB/YeaQ/YmgE family stress response membrane protein [Corynebacterium liangguodongii]|uniref:GlsB/YeaQ/YmgE family stress response membrane protein n=1 Tax=Corynebacterium liangguodongii TaxID=2079535 RepID=A0A2S0WGN5_9CORY|nr:GlsB/YeaQ/YmgE family stress response membrane protein [Corynebacterium liangguodongii]AWB84884.1 GlsB/YeaQ/YmgE family stress response membrane protein [Corynebacterium liangguodongii]PWB99240.1 GlsB/YeaQ/YmgE family stress response membrane protein [Corynebacterium liangguodongii]
MKWGFIGWIVLGGLAGWIASKIKGRDAQMGIGLNIIVGIIGGLLGGWILGLFLDDPMSNIFMSFITCLIGAVVLLTIVNLFTGSRR